MPRLSQQVAVVPVALVQQLTELHTKVQGAQRDALRYAKECGDVLRLVPAEERAALAAASGITGRSTRFDYVAVSEHWVAVQHAGSIRQAMKIIRRPKRAGPFLWAEWLDIFRWFDEERQALYLKR